MTRKRKLFLSLLLVTLTASLALTPLVLTYQLRFNSGVAGGSGGAVMHSAGYRLEGSLGGSTLILASSAGYRLCSGFAGDALYAINLPFLTH